MQKKDMERFSTDFINLVNTYCDFNAFVEELKNHYWLKRNDWLADSLPWNEIRDARLKKIKIELFDDVHALLVCDFETFPGNVMTFTLVKEGDEWKVDWQNRDVYDVATRHWEKRIRENLEIRFFETISDEEIEYSTKELMRANARIREELGDSPEKIILIFGFYAFECRLAENGAKPDGGDGGSVRGKLITINMYQHDLSKKDFKNTNFKAILLHELVHEYTMYDCTWGGSKYHNGIKYSLFSEGIATYYQYLYLAELLKADQVKKRSQSSQSVIAGIECARKNRDRLFELLDNQEFITFNRSQNGVSNPSYYLSASLYNYFIETLGFEKTKSLIMDFENLDIEQVKEKLQSSFDENEYMKSSERYFDHLIKELTDPMESDMENRNRDR